MIEIGWVIQGIFGWDYLEWGGRFICLLGDGKVLAEFQRVNLILHSPHMKGEKQEIMFRK